MKDEFSDRRPLWPVWEKIQRLQPQPLKFIAVFVKREISVNYGLLALLFTFTFSGNLSDVPGIHKNIKTMLHSDSQARLRPIFNYSQHFITFDLNEKCGKLNKIRFFGIKWQTFAPCDELGSSNMRQIFGFMICHAFKLWLW